MSSEERASAPRAASGGAPGAPGGEEPSSFEALYERLERVAEELGAGGLSLERSVALYEEGMRLAASCERLLADVEQRIEMLRPAPAPLDAGADAGVDGGRDGAPPEPPPSDRLL